MDAHNISAILTDGETDVRIGLPQVRCVGIVDLAAVVEHRIVAIVDSTSHYLRLNNGGELFYVYNGRGQLIELSGSGIHVTLSPEGNCVVRTA